MKYETRKYEIHNTQHTTTTQEPRPKQDFQEFCPGPPGSSQNSLFGSSGPQVLEEVVGSSIPQSRYIAHSHLSPPHILHPPISPHMMMYTIISKSNPQDLSLSLLLFTERFSNQISIFRAKKAIIHTYIHISEFDKKKLFV